jgi:hypothetical protein
MTQHSGQLVQQQAVGVGMRTVLATGQLLQELGRVRRVRRAAQLTALVLLLRVHRCAAPWLHGLLGCFHAGMLKRLRVQQSCQRGWQQGLECPERRLPPCRKQQQLLQSQLQVLLLLLLTQVMETVVKARAALKRSQRSQLVQSAAITGTVCTWSQAAARPAGHSQVLSLLLLKTLQDSSGTCNKLCPSCLPLLVLTMMTSKSMKMHRSKALTIPLTQQQLRLPPQQQQWGQQDQVQERGQHRGKDRQSVCLQRFT